MLSIVNTLGNFGACIFCCWPFLLDMISEDGVLLRIKTNDGMEVALLRNMTSDGNVLLAHQSLSELRQFPQSVAGAVAAKCSVK